MFKKKRILVAMSGGVDSSVAAALLKEQGHFVVGACMQVWDYSKNKEEQGNGTCCSSSDVEDARAVCKSLDIPFYVINCESLFEDTVIKPFVKDYEEGRTPIPCINCNTFLKFHHLVSKMKELDCDHLATGHYASIRTLASGKKGIFMSEDQMKDQTYFLFTINPDVLPHILFPVGDLSKTQVRELAKERALPVFNKKDSTGICFVGSGKYQNFIDNYTQNRPFKKKEGDLKLYPDGEVLGQHSGIHGFTVGLRKGLGISHKQALYVIKIDSKTGDVWLGEEKYLYCQEVRVKTLNLLDKVTPGERLHVKIRSHHRKAQAFVYNEGEYCQLKFVTPQKSITPGQSAVFYRDKQLLGGGVITQGTLL